MNPLGLLGYADCSKVIDNTLLVAEDRLFVARLIRKRDLETTMNVAGYLEPFANRLTRKLRLREDRWIRPKEYFRAGPSGCRHPD